MKSNYDESLYRNEEGKWYYTKIFKWVEDANLDPYEFRVYCHIAKVDLCWKKLNTIAIDCRMSRQRVQKAIKSLHSKGLITWNTRSGRSSILTAVCQQPSKKAYWVARQKPAYVRRPHEGDPDMSKESTAGAVEVTKSASVRLNTRNEANAGNGKIFPKSRTKKKQSEASGKHLEIKQRAHVARKIPSRPDCVEDVIKYAEEKYLTGHTGDYAEMFFERGEKSKWILQGSPCRNWRRAYEGWCAHIEKCRCDGCDIDVMSIYESDEE